MRTLIIVWAAILTAPAALLAGEGVGWRGDGSGIYSNTRPPTEWARDKNILWATSMPDWSNASPVVAENRLFVQSEPFNLLCVDANTGRILWTRSHDYSEVMTEADKRQAVLDAEKAAMVRAEIARLRKHVNDCGRALGQVTALTSQPDSGHAVKVPVGDRVDDFHHADAENYIARLKHEVALTGNKLAEQNDLLGPLTRWEKPPTNEVNGYSSPTPVTDGWNVWCLFGNGVAACYDMHGNRQWIRFVGKSTIEDGFSSSPVLVRIPGPALPRMAMLVHADELTALDAETGQTLWRAENTPASYGTPVVAVLDSEPVAVTPKGDVVGIRDGRVLARKTGSVYYCSPVVAESVAYFVQNISKAHGGGEVVRLTRTGEAVAAEKLWQTGSARDRYYASPVVHAGLVYVLTQANVLSVLDAADGKVVKEIRLELGKGTCFPSLCLVGESSRMLFASSDTGMTAVIRPGRDAEVVALNSLEPFRSTPLFVGGRVYIRGSKTLYCIASRKPRQD